MWRTARAAGTLSGGALFNTENAIFSRDCSVVRKYAKIRNA